MQTNIAKWGNSLALRLPRNLIADVHLYEGAPVNLRIEGASLVVTPARPKYKLSDLLEHFRPEDRGKEVDWGPARGKEVW